MTREFTETGLFVAACRGLEVGDEVFLFKNENIQISILGIKTTMTNKQLIEQEVEEYLKTSKNCPVKVITLFL